MASMRGGLVGDAGARGPKKLSGVTEYKDKRSRRRSYEAVDSTPEEDSGGDAEGHAAAKRSTKGMRVGPGLKGAEVFDAVGNMRNATKKSFKTIYPKDDNSDAGSHVEEWCQGKRKSYK
jgi:hypothetical protein